MMEGEEPWRRQPGESAPAYEVFLKYLTTRPAERDEALKAMKTIEDMNKIARWMQVNRWQERAKNYDEHLAVTILDQTESERALAAQKRMEVSSALLDVAKAQILEWKNDIEEGRPVRLTPSEVSKLVEIGCKIDRLEHGESTENVSVKGRITDMTDELLVSRAQKILEGMLKR